LKLGSFTIISLVIVDGVLFLVWLFGNYGKGEILRIFKHKIRPSGGGAPYALAFDHKSKATSPLLDREREKEVDLLGKTENRVMIGL
jgi:hypothetical protein